LGGFVAFAAIRFVRTMSENHKIAKAATTIGVGTFVSRITGFLRDTRNASGKAAEKALFLGVGIMAGLGIYVACSYWMKNEEISFFIRMAKGKRRQATFLPAG